MDSVMVTLHGTLNLYAPNRTRSFLVELAESSTAGQLLESLGLPLGMLSMLLINDKRAEAESPVAGGDHLEAFPLCAGGSE